MKKTEYSVSLDITFSKTIYVEAENKEEAKRLAMKKVRDEPFYYARTADAYVGAKVVDVY